jgi:hypothetical protein
VFSPLNSKLSVNLLCDDSLSGYCPRLRESREGIYNMKDLAPTCGELKYHDVADYLGTVSVADIPGQGKGRIVNMAIPARTLLLAAQAFAMAPSAKSIGIQSQGVRLMLIIVVMKHFTDSLSRTGELCQLNSRPLPTPPLLDGIAHVNRIQHTCRMNQWVIGDDLSVKSAESDVGDLPCALWIMPSFMNHSCDANPLRICLI